MTAVELIGKRKNQFVNSSRAGMKKKHDNNHYNTDLHETTCRLICIQNICL